MLITEQKTIFNSDIVSSITSEYLNNIDPKYDSVKFKVALTRMECKLTQVLNLVQFSSPETYEKVLTALIKG